MKKVQIIFVPAPWIGHIVSTIKFAELMLQQDDQLSITLLVLKLPITPFVDPYVDFLTASLPRIHLIRVPEEPEQNFPTLDLLKRSPESYISISIEIYVPQVKSIFADILSGSVQVAGVVLDWFCVPMIDIATELGLPAYIFLTSSAGFLSLSLDVPKRPDQIGFGFSKSDTDDILIPGFVDPVPRKVLPTYLFDKDCGYATYIKLTQKFKDAKGIVVNTFQELEPDLVDYLLDGGQNNQPPVYPVGPVLNLQLDQPNPDFDHAQWDKIIKWLDMQPDSSVVFLCFGSVWSFSSNQVKEIALGLERSGHTFLWCVRVNSQNEKCCLEEIFPQGFLERTEGRGMICVWAQQVEVLAHRATGGFVSHCGWNSILESLWHGVPIATLPIYAEQQLNAFELVKELGLAVELKLDYGTESHVTSGEMERAVKSLMESDCGVRKRVKEMGELARKAVMDSGSSFTSVAQLMRDIKAAIE